VDDNRRSTRVEIALDALDANPDLLFAFVAGQAERLVDELRRAGVDAEMVSLEVAGIRRYYW